MILFAMLCNSWMKCVVFWILSTLIKTAFSCDFPATLRDAQFKDSSNQTVKENIYFYTSNVLWRTSIHGTNIFMWNCHQSNSKEIVIKGTQTVTYNSQQHYAYQCLLYTETNSSILYYFPVREITDGSRVILSTNPNLSVCDVCSSIEPELHTMYLQASSSCDCIPSCSDLTVSGTCSQSIDLTNVQCSKPTTLTTETTEAATITASITNPTGGSASSNSSSTSKKSQTETVFTVEVIVILSASLVVLCLILVTSTVAIVIYNRNEQLKRQFLKVRKVRPAETA